MLATQILIFVGSSVGESQQPLRYDLVMTHALFSLIQFLEEQRLWFRIDRLRPDSVMVTVTLVGERLEIDVFEDGHFEYSRFRGNEDVESAPEQLFAILRLEGEKSV